MLNIIQTNVYAYDDPQHNGDEMEVRFTIDGKDVLSGDWYHNKIDSQIEGFLAALDYLGVAYAHTEVNTNEESMEEFDEDEEE